MVQNVGTGGILSGIFTDEADLFDKMTLLLADYTADFNTWIETGRGEIFNDVLNDTSHTWLDSAVIDSANTQVLCPQMIGLDLRTYIIDKLKGLIL